LDSAAEEASLGGVESAPVVTFVEASLESPVVGVELHADRNAADPAAKIHRFERMRLILQDAG
jgi:hypothetical protein